MVDLGNARTDGVKFGLKLYHAREFQLDCQQLATEAPRIASVSGSEYRRGPLKESIGNRPNLRRREREKEDGDQGRHPF